MAIERAEVQKMSIIRARIVEVWEICWSAFGTWVELTRMKSKAMAARLRVGVVSTETEGKL